MEIEGIPITDHGLLLGLAGDDHSQYLLASGARELAGDWSLGGFDLTNGGSGTFANILVGDGAVGAPSLGFTDAPTTGIYRSGSGSSETINFAISGTRHGYFEPSGLSLKDTLSAYYGQISFAGTAMTADRLLTFNLDNGPRTLRFTAGIWVEDSSNINQDVTTDSLTVEFGALAVTNAITGLTFNGLTQSISLLGTWLITDGISQLEVSADCDLDQNLSTVSDVTHNDVTINDLTINTPSNIYALNHDSFAGFLAGEHIDWTDTTEDLLTTGSLIANSLTIAANNYIGCIGAPSAIQIEADGDVVLAADLLMGGNIVQNANVYITNALYHYGDLDTGLIFSTDLFYFNVGGAERMRFALGNPFNRRGVIINNNGDDVDFSVNGDTVDDIIRVDADEDKVNLKVTTIGDGGATNYTGFSATGDQTFNGTAGFYPRFLTQADEPAAGTGATQCDTSEMVIWKDSDDSKVYLCFNDGGTVKTAELA